MLIYSGRVHNGRKCHKFQENVSHPPLCVPLRPRPTYRITPSPRRQFENRVAPTRCWETVVERASSYWNFALARRKCARGWCSQASFVPVSVFLPHENRLIFWRFIYKIENVHNIIVLLRMIEGWKTRGKFRSSTDSGNIFDRLFIYTYIYIHRSTIRLTQNTHFIS